ncbi:MAG: hypothetical protein M5U13_18110 [Thermoanaerobaculia bacterium]|nr:hypothetical protein [Thermoanaerobaculia bacterium]
MTDRISRPGGRAARRWLLAVTLLAVSLLAPPLGSAPLAASEPPEERLERLEREVAALREALARLAASPAPRAPQSPETLEAATPAAEPAPTAVSGELAELSRRVDLLAEELESLRVGEAAARADSAERGMGPAASKVYRTREGLSIGGYGEVVYQRFEERRDDGARSGRTDEADLLRGIVYFGYKWTDRWLLNTEIEFEHGSTGEGGEVSVEFAYLDYLWRDELGARAGLLLVPMGFLNELHEPTTFLGARRPGVESAIIPTTWRELGFGVHGELGPWSYRSYLVNGLDASGFSASGIRGGRQKGARAKAEDWAWTGRLDYTAIPGLLAGASAYVGGSGQGLRDAAGESVGDVRTTLLEAHVEWKWRGLELRALGVHGEVDDVPALNRALGLTGSRSVGERQEGGYVEAGFDLLSLAPASRQALVPFARLERYDTQARVPAGFARNPANDVEVLTLGLAWRPIPQAVLKIDWQDVDNAAGTGIDQLNVALGYIF